ncbi:MAG TPA: SdrD B-like domain-containing protein [Tepidisphaeraceae bacterium]|jgi:uncharacterized delta-60 repeat protein|nr:SdrD B-like domain-containing protein [Tepidisphaeraceae bacterium]
MESRVLLSAGTLNATFFHNGERITSQPAGTEAISSAVVAEPGGQIAYLTVSQPVSNGAPAGAAIVQVQRLQSNGQTDTTYGTAGVATIPFTAILSGLAQPDVLILQPDFKVLVGVGNVLARLTTSGELDTTFGNGKGYETIATSETGGVLQNDGKILVAGAAPGSNAPAVFRYNADGSIDTTYGVNGVAKLTSSSLTLGDAGDVVIDGDGRALVSMAASSPAIRAQYVVARLTTAGTLDTSFGAAGFASDGGQSSNDADGFSTLAVAPNGTVYLGGNYDQGDGDEATLSAFNSAGKLIAGVPQTGPTLFGGIVSLVAQSNNKVVASGFEFYNSAGAPSSTGTNTSVFVDRFLVPTASVAPLKLDTTFNGTGQQALDFSAPDVVNYGGDHDSGEFGDFGYSISQNASGGIIVAGVTNEPNSMEPFTEFTLAELNGDTPLVEEISGVVFNDTNNDGIQGDGETGFAGVTVYQDPNYNHKHDASEQSTVTDSSGNYVFASAPADPEILRVILPAGDTQTFPAGNIGQYVGANNGLTHSGVNFGLHGTATGSISGHVFNDINSNGIDDDGTGGVGNVQIYVDLKNTGSFATGDPTATTDDSGDYTIVGVAPGNYTVRMTVPLGDEQSSPPAFGQGDSITVQAGKTATGTDFGLITSKFPVQEEIVGTVFNDLNHDGVQDNGETGIAGVTVYQDPNYNHMLDAGEQSVVTDANGNFDFNDPPADPEILRVILPANFTQSFPASNAGQYVGKNTGQQLAGINFGIYSRSAGIGGSISGHVNDSNSQPVAGVTVYEDPNYNHKIDLGEQFTTTDANGNFTFTNLPADPEIIRIVVPAGRQQILPANGAGFYVGKNTGANITTVTFEISAAAPPPTRSISGTVFNDTNHDGAQDNGEKGIPGVTVYQDPNYNHKLDATEQSTVTDANGNYTFANPPADPEIIRVILPAGDTQAFPVTNAGQYVGKNTGPLTGVNFALNVPTSEIAGTVFNDLNHNGIQDNGEPGLAGVVVYGDPNYNKKIDSGELHMVTDANGNYAFVNPTSDPLIIRIVLPSGEIQTFPAGGGGQQTAEYNYQVGGVLTGLDFGVFIPTAGHNGTITGSIFDDSNGDHKLDDGEGNLGGATAYLDLNHDGKFDTGDVSTNALGNGEFTFLGLAPGSYSVGFDLGSGAESLQTFPLSGFATVTVAAGQTVSAGMFGVQPEGAASPTAAAVGGGVYLDTNLDGNQDYNEPGIAGVKVYIDLQNSGSYVVGDPVAVTNPLGEYIISNIPPGDYAIREVVPAGYTQSTPAGNAGFSVSLNAGEGLSAFEFGLTAP